MKIRIPAQTVNVNAEDWAIAYGIHPSTVSNDVKMYFEGYFQQQVEALGLQAEEHNRKVHFQEMAQRCHDDPDFADAYERDARDR